jgi:hypothetical protein
LRIVDFEEKMKRAKFYPLVISHQIRSIFGIFGSKIKKTFLTNTIPEKKLQGK